MDSKLSAQWQNLKQAWEAARAAAEKGQREIDKMVDEYLARGGALPSKEMRLHVEDLFYQECEARGAMDQFIDEECG